MNKCLKITLVASFPDGFLQNFIKKHAIKLDIEGTARLVDNEEKRVVIVACGTKENVDAYIDVLHKGTKGCEIDTLEIEPFLKEKDYRRVFRVIE